jgi:predicted phage tail protein
MSTEADCVLDLMTPPQTFLLVEVPNPFEPQTRVEMRLDWRAGLTVAQALEGITNLENLLVTLNGGALAPEDFATTQVPEQSCLLYTEVPEGRGMKSVLRMVIVVVAVMYGQTYAIGAGWGAAGTAAFTAGVGVASSLLVNALLPVAELSNLADQSSSPTYGIDGAKNTSTEGIRVPVCYGTFRMAGNLISMHVRNVTETQYLYALINAGEGQLGGLSDIEINEQPATNFQDVEIQTRVGTSDQTPIDWFSESITPFSQGATLNNTSFATYSGSNVIDRFRLDFVAPQGLFEMDDKGQRRSATVGLHIEYRKVGDATWEPMASGTEVDSYTSVYVLYNTLDPRLIAYGNYGVTKYTTLPAGYTLGADNTIYKGALRAGYVEQSASYATGNLSVTANTTSPYRWSLWSPTLPQGVYEVRVQRTSAESTDDKRRDQIVWSDYNEIVNDTVAYRWTGLVAVKIKLTDQLNSVPTITYLNHGRMIKYWKDGDWAGGPSSNPAWIVWDMLTNMRFGGQMDESRLDLDAFKAWGDYCDSAGLTFNGVIDAEQSMWDALQYVFRCGHARPSPVGTRLSVVVERPSTPTMLFTVGNIIQGTFSQEWLGTSSRANEVELSYFDKTDRNKQRTIKVYDDQVAAGAPQNTATMTMLGVDTAERATQEAIFQLKLNRFIRSSCTFESPIEALGCSVGDVILVQHDQPNWGVGGRLEAGSNGPTHIVLDKQVTLEAGKSYKLLVHFNALPRFSGYITAIAGNAISLSGYSGQQNLDRLVANGEDKRITGYHANGVLVEDASGLINGSAFICYQTDAIETRDVGTGASTTNQLVLTSGLPATPTMGQNYMLGEAAVVTRTWRINSITMGSTDMARQITCFEYNDAIYDWTNSLGGAVQPVANWNQTVPNVTHLSLTELTDAVGTSAITRVTAAWVPPADFASFDGVDVYVALDNTQYVHAASLRAGTNTYSFDVIVGTPVLVKVVARSSQGRTALYTQAPTATLTVGGDVFPPALPTEVNLTVPTVGLQVSWVDPLDVDFIGVEVLRSLTASTADGAILYRSAPGQSSWVDMEANLPTQDYFYWVRSIDAAGNTTTWVPCAPTHARPHSLEASITALLTNESHVLGADAAGVVSDFSGAIGQLRVYEGITDVTGLAAFSKVAQSGVTASIDGGGNYAVTAMSADTGSVTFRATYKTIQIDKTFSLAKSRTGAAGTGLNAKLLSLSANSQIFTFDGDGVASPGGQSIVLTAVRQNISSASVFTTTPDTVLTGSGDTRTLTLANFGANTSVKVSVTADGYTDEVTIVRLSNGQTAIVGSLSNDAATLVADAAGTVASFAAATGNFKVYKGTADVTSSATFSVFSAVGCTADVNTATNTPVTGQARGYYRVTAMSADTATVTLRAVVGGVTIDKVFVISKAKAGVSGSSAKVITLYADRQTFKFDGTGALNPAGQYVTLSVARQNTTNPTAWTTLPAVSLRSGTSQASSTTTAGDTVYLHAADFGANQYVIVTATVIDGGNLVDKVMIVRLADGAGGTPGASGASAVSVNLSNDSVSLPSYTNGTVIDYSSATGQIRVYDGGTDVTAAATIAVVAAGCTGSVNTGTNTPVNGQPKGYYQVTAMATPTATLTFTITYNGVSYTRIFALSRSDRGFEIASSLPASNLFAGRIVFLTTDNKLYRFTGSDWTRAVDGADLMANSVTTDSLIAAAVTAAKLAANSVSSDNIIARSVTGDKLIIGANSGGLSRWPDPHFSDPSLYSPQGAGLPTFVGWGAMSGGGQGVTTRYFSVKPGALYRYSLQVYREQSQTGVAYMRHWSATFQDGSDGTYQNGYAEALASPPGQWWEYSFYLTPTNVFLALDLHIGYGGTGGVMYVRNLVFEECVNGVSIADGAITGVKLAVQSVTADKIMARTITADRFLTNQGVDLAAIVPGALNTSVTGYHGVDNTRYYFGNVIMVAQTPPVPCQGQYCIVDVSGLWRDWVGSGPTTTIEIMRYYDVSPGWVTIATYSGTPPSTSYTSIPTSSSIGFGLPSPGLSLPSSGNAYFCVRFGTTNNQGGAVDEVYVTAKTLFMK